MPAQPLQPRPTTASIGAGAIASSLSPVPGEGMAVIGLQWGDEGKGKVIDLLASRFDAVVRYNGGANAGHSVVIGGRRHALHLLPSGVFHKGVLGVIGNGVVVDPEALLREIEGLREAGVDPLNLALSDRAHVVMPYHRQEDTIRESLLAGEDQDRSIGTTKRGIGPAYADKAHRSGAIRVGDLLRPDLLAERLDRACAVKSRTLAALSTAPFSLDPAALLDSSLALGERLAPFITDTTYLLHGLLARKGSLLFEGANATLLDLDHGTFPFVTSSNCSVLGIPAGSGVPGRLLTKVVGVLKAYSTRVGGGPFPTELPDSTGDRIRDRGREYGTTTGRPRRCGWLDLVALRYAVMLNGVTSLSLMLLDVLAGFDEIKVAVAYRRPDGTTPTTTPTTTDRFLPDAHDLARVTPVYETLPGFAQEITEAREFDDLPGEARRFVRFIESFLAVPVSIVSVGPDRAQTIVVDEKARRQRAT